MGLNKIQTSNTDWGKAAADLNSNFDSITTDLSKVKNATTRNKGFFSDDNALKAAFPTAYAGDYAYVGTANPYQTWLWKDSAWVKLNDDAGHVEVELGNYYTSEEVDEKFTDTDAKLSELGQKVNNNSNNIEGLNSSFQGRNGDNLFICDRMGNVVAEINEKGISSVGFYENGERVVSGSKDIVDRFSGEFYITDKAGNVILRVNESGLMTIGLNTNNMKKNSWGGKIVATYGDSVTALNGGDFVSPYGDKATKSKWAGKVAKYFDFAKIHNRGIGSTTFKYYNENGGQLAWCKTDTGEYVNRSDSYNYDNYQGNVTIPSNCTAIRGSGSSWLRIKTMFPESIKDTIDAVFIQYHNDFHQDMDTDCKWVEGSSYDPEWAASEYYETYGGDYNIQTVKGGIASTIMKFQAWMPNALVVLMTPISGVYINGNEEVKEIENVESAKMRKLAEVVKEISFKMSIPCIDVYGNDGINTLNHKLDGYITDGIHPYSDAGCNKIARAIISGLESIIPNIN